MTTLKGIWWRETEGMARSANELGERCTYSLKRGSCGWQRSREEVWEAHARIDRRVRREEGEAILDGELTIAEARRYHRHNVIARLAEEFQWNYRRLTSS
jgi:hypothetical protein